MDRIGIDLDQRGEGDGQGDERRDGDEDIIVPGIVDFRSAFGIPCHRCPGCGLRAHDLAAGDYYEFLQELSDASAAEGDLLFSNGLLR